MVKVSYFRKRVPSSMLDTVRLLSIYFIACHPVFQNAVSCGCAPGLDCVKSGLITKRCMDVTPGSADY